MLLNCGVGKDSWESLGQQRDRTSPSYRRSVLGVHWKDWCWSWNSNTLATWFEELTHWKRPWRWERLKAGGEGDDRGWDGWMASPTQWTWVGWTPGVSDGQGGLARCSPWGRIESDMTVWLNWTKLIWFDSLEKHHSSHILVICQGTTAHAIEWGLLGTGGHIFVVQAMGWTSAGQFHSHQRDICFGGNNSIVD